MNELEKKVLELINTVTGSIYISTLKVIVDDDAYILKLTLNQEQSPMLFYYQGNESGFLKYLEKDLRSRQIERAHYYKLLKVGEDKDEIITIN